MYRKCLQESSWKRYAACLPSKACMGQEGRDSLIRAISSGSSCPGLQRSRPCVECYILTTDVPKGTKASQEVRGGGMSW